MAKPKDNQTEVIKAVDSVCESLIDTGAKVDRENNAIRGVKVIGITSKNGRDYPESVLQESVARYEGVRINIDHPDKPGQSRKLGDRFGVLESVAYKSGSNPGIYADLKYNPKHTLAEQIIWAAENDPGSVGLSHNASVRISPGQGGRKTVESIDAVRSVDLVADPATTNGIFEHDDSGATEGLISDQIQHDSQREAVRKLVRTAQDLMREVSYSDDVTPQQYGNLIIKIANDLVSELKKIPTPTNETESESMDLSDLTIEQLRESRPDLVQAVEATQAETLEQVTEERDTLLAEKKNAEHAALVESEITAVKLNPADKRHVSDVFRRTLLAMESKEDRTAAIADRAQLVLESEIGSGKPSPGSGHQKPVTSTGYRAPAVAQLTTESIASCFS